MGCASIQITFSPLFFVDFKIRNVFFRSVLQFLQIGFQMILGCGGAREGGVGSGGATRRSHSPHWSLSTF